ncbi:MAG: ABC transporter ATP-binding protein/permease, partial [Gammaproteobacteria bacterium]|nr:ABC transporter ATP-binding protein/permease [Gammaproteobacteria bacterium]
PISLFLLYGVLRLFGSLFNEVRDAVFARVRYRAMRRLSNKVLKHLHKLSLRYHLERRTGNIVRDLERGTGSISQILNYLVFNIVPTFAEFILVAFILLGQYEAKFALITFSTVAIYIVFTLLVTEWRMHYRHRMNALDSKSNGQAVDSLINYETVKYFNNELFEVQRYDSTLSEWENAAVKSQTSMSILNFGQGAIIAVGLTFIMVYAGQGVVEGKMTLGDLVLINTMMLQLFMPLSFLGIIYRMLKHTLADMDMVFKLLDEDLEIKDSKNATVLKHSRGEISFEHVDFSYQDDRKILHDISFTVKPGQKLAIVGHSGSGKSTLARLLYRFYEVSDGRILYDNQDISQVTQASLRQAIGIVPQDTVLFNESILYNIEYAKPGATQEEVIRAAKLANIHEFIESLPDGYDTAVGERGLKLSGGEKQRIAIARVILKASPILIFDEATSSLDSKSEKIILEALSSVAQTHTTLVIAHRLSTITDSDQILVMDKGRIVEQGTHQSLLDKSGLYADMWQLQLQESVDKES